MKYEKALTQLEKLLHPDEHILDQGPATVRGSANQPAVTGALALTASRLIFFGSAGLGKREFSFPLQAIVSIDSQRNFVSTYTVITVQGGVAHTFAELSPRLRSVIDEARFGGAGSAAPGVADARGEDGVGQLERLARLYSEGALTEAEFVAAKSRMLGL